MTRLSIGLALSVALAACTSIAPADDIPLAVPTFKASDEIVNNISGTLVWRENCLRLESTGRSPTLIWPQDTMATLTRVSGPIRNGRHYSIDIGNSVTLGGTFGNPQRLEPIPISDLPNNCGKVIYFVESVI